MPSALRRHIRLVQQQMHSMNPEERTWLKSQGYDRPEELPRRSIWYRPDGSSGLGPSDLYHLRLYRQRGMTLKPPEPRTDDRPRKQAMPWLASRVLKVLGDNERWQGTPAELAGRCGMSPVGMSRAIFAPKVSVALAC
mgnify:CR=1 FL=1